MKQLLNAAAGVFAVVPGVAVLWAGFAVPPGYNWLFSGVIEFSGVLTLLIIILNRGKFKRISKQRINVYVIRAVFVFIVAILVSVSLMLHCLVTSTKYSDYGAVFFPLWTTGHVAELIVNAGGRQAVIDKFGPTPVVQALSQMSGSVIGYIITIFLMLVAYTTTICCMTVAFAIPGVKIGKGESFA